MNLLAMLAALAATLTAPVAPPDEGATEVLVAPGETDDTGRVMLPAGQRLTVLEVNGPGILRSLTLLPPLATDPVQAAAGVRLEARWDGRPDASIDAPIGDLFGAVPGAAYASDLGTVAPEVWELSLPMPFGDGARLELVNTSAVAVRIGFRALLTRLKEPPTGPGRLHVDHTRAMTTGSGLLPMMSATGTRGHLVGVRVDLRTWPGDGAGGADLVARLDGRPPVPLASSLWELFGARQPVALPTAGLVAATQADGGVRLAGYRSWLAAPVRFSASCELALDLGGLPGGTISELTATVLWYAPRALGRATPPGPLPVGMDEPKVPPDDHAADPPQPVAAADPNVHRTPEARGLDGLYQQAPTDQRASLLFDDPGDLARVATEGMGGGAPRIIDQPTRGAGQPNPGRQGVLAMQPASAGEVARLAWKVALPSEAQALAVSFSIDPYESPGDTDVLARFRVFDGHGGRLLREMWLFGGKPADVSGWTELTLPLGPLRSRTVLILVEVIPAGDRSRFTNEELFIDSLRIVGGPSVEINTITPTHAPTEAPRPTP